MPQFHSFPRGKLQARLSREHSRGRKLTAKERKQSEVREADRLDARRAARIAKSRKREAYELLREPSASEVEQARRLSSSDEEEEEEEQKGDDDEASGHEQEKEVEEKAKIYERSVWWADGKSTRMDNGTPKSKRSSAKDLWNGAEGHDEKKRRRGIGEDGGKVDSLREGPFDKRKKKKSKTSPSPIDFANGKTVPVLNGGKLETVPEDEQVLSSGISSTTKKTDVPLLKTVERQEKEYLHRDTFPASELQPARDFLEVMANVAPIFGDSGAGWSRFGPKTPDRSTFLLMSSADAASDASRYALSGSVEARQYDPNSFLYDAKKTNAAKNMNSGGVQIRKFSQTVEPLMRTQHLEIDLLQRKISHGELMGLKLRLDAKRLAADLAGSSTSVKGTVGVVLWRLVRVSAKVAVPGYDDEMHVAWYVILDRSCGGFF